MKFLCIIVIQTIFLGFLSNIEASLVSTQGTNINLGKQPADIMQVEVPLKNTGDHDIKIQYIHPSCNCTSVEILDSILAPNSETVLMVEFDLQKGNGYKNTIINVYYNDKEDTKETQNMHCNLIADVQQVIELTPIGNSILRKFPKNNWYYGNFNLKNNSEEELKVKILPHYNKEYCSFQLYLSEEIVLKPHESISVDFQFKINYLYNNEVLSFQVSELNSDKIYNKTFTFSR